MRIQPAVIGVFKNKNKFLLTRRVFFDPEDKQFFPYAWNLPGGGIEFGEKPEDSIVREMKEELGLKIKVIRLLPKIYTEVRNNWQGIFLIYICEILDVSQKIVLNEEADKIGWFTLKQVETLKTMPQTVSIIKGVLKF